MPTTIAAALMGTILTRLAKLFLEGAGGDVRAARNAANQMLAAAGPRTEDELRLAAQVISFSLQALEALGQAADPNLPLTRILRLRSGAVSLSRESHKAQRRLDQIQSARRDGLPAAPAAIQQAQQPSPQAAKAEALIEDTGTIKAFATANGMTWTQALQQRMRANRIAANLKKSSKAQHVGATRDARIQPVAIPPAGHNPTPPAPAPAA